jgi:hypothetical protein
MKLTADNFESFVEKDPVNGCWIWKGKTLHGYGRTQFNGRSEAAHRVAYFLFKGDPSGMNVCHSCDRPPCVNPDHLWLGTQADNMADMVKKGRNKGERGPGRPKKPREHHHRPSVRLNQHDAEILATLSRVYGSEAQAIRVAIRRLAEETK